MVLPRDPCGANLRFAVSRRLGTFAAVAPAELPAAKVTINTAACSKTDAAVLVLLGGLIGMLLMFVMLVFAFPTAPDKALRRARPVADASSRPTASNGALPTRLNAADTRNAAAGVRLCPTACPTGPEFPMAKPNQAGIIIRVSGVRVPPPAPRQGPATARTSNPARPRDRRVSPEATVGSGSSGAVALASNQQPPLRPVRCSSGGREHAAPIRACVLCRDDPAP